MTLARRMAILTALYLAQGLMMSRTERSIGASHYTALAGIEVLGKFPGGWISGPLAEHLGYAHAFLIAAILTAAQLVTIPRLRRRS